MPAFVHTPLMNASMAPPSTSRRSPVSVKQVTSNEELIAALTVRQRVFVDEMGIPATEEFDSNDIWPTTRVVPHFLVSVERQPIATCRLNLEFGAGIKLEHMAVLKAARRKGVGLALLNHLERLPMVSSSRGPLFCFAMKDKELFYRNSGWVVEEGHDHLQETIIPHVAMVRRRRPHQSAPFGSASLSHVMIRTADLARARHFYSLLGFQDVSRFSMGGVRGVWIESPYIDQKIELLEMPSPDLDANRFPDGDKSPIAEFATAAAAATSSNIGHIAMDVSRACTDLTRFLDSVQKESIDRFQIGLRVLERPREMPLGNVLMEVSFISDADGTLLELMRFIRDLKMDAG